MFYKYVLLLIFIGFQSQLYSQKDIITSYDSIIALDFTLFQKEKVVKELIKENNTQENELNISHIYHEFAKYGRRNNNLNFAIEYTKLACNIRKKYFEIDSELYKKSLNNLAGFQVYQKNYFEALNSYNDLLKICNDFEIRKGNVFFMKGRIYREIGDYKTAINYYKKAEIIYTQKKNLRKCIDVYIAFLNVYRRFEANNSDFLETFAKIKALEKNFEIKQRSQVKILINLGDFYNLNYQYNKAIETYDKAIKVCNDNGDTINLIKCLVNKSICKKHLKDYEGSKQLLENALLFVKDNQVEKAAIYDNQADIYLIQKNYPPALQHYHKAIYRLIPTEADYQNVPQYKNIELSPNKVDIFGYLIDKANAWVAFGDAKNKPEYYQKAIQTFELADRTIDLIYFQSRENFSKLHWRKKAADFYNKATALCHKLQQPEKAFYFIEKGKALLLLENMTNIQAKNLANLPDDVIEREFKLLKNISKAEEELAESKNQNSTHLDSLKNIIFNHKDSFTNFIDSLEVTFPKYAKFKKKVNVTKAKSTQNFIAANDIILQYNIGEEHGYMSLITKDTIQLFKLNTTKKLQQYIETYQQALQKPFVNQTDRIEYIKIASQLYKELFPFSKENTEFIKNKELIIIPDNSLQFIPFESLIVDKNLPLQNSYLLNFCDVSYAYSVSSLIQTNKNNHTYQNEFINISPIEFSDKSLSTLTHENTTTAFINNLFETKTLDYQNASKQNFKNVYGNYKIIHLSTHGGVEDGAPWLAFHDEKLKLNKMYFQNQKSDLVVLSACQTSQGELQKGEGVLSIARGFINAGSKSVLASLWNLDNRAASQITQPFYKNLKAGQTKSQALKNAKLTYLKKHQNTSEASPYYWSSLTLIGNDQSIIQSNNKFLYLFGLIIPLLIVFIYKKKITFR